MSLARRLYDRVRFRDADDLDNRDEEAVALFARVVASTLERYHRAEVRGVERIPKGAALYVGNHNSFAYTPDTYLFSLAAYRAHGLEAVPHGLAHGVLIGWPFVNQILTPLGAVRASHDNGERLLRAGKKVLVYPGGDVDSLRTYRDRHRLVFDGRRGYVRLALRCEVPIVPVVAAGAHRSILVLHDGRFIADAFDLGRRLRAKVWPIMLSVPWGLTVGPVFPFLPLPFKILIEILEPIHFARRGPEAADDDAYVAECATLVETRMQATLTRLSAEL
ncbi:MAG: 1-acyl-sn-glycerol-3-phosphate acyltransferase [Polyangiaceae bacterium]